MPQKACHMRWSEVAVEPMNALLTRQFITGAQAMISRLVLQRGCIVARHAHANEQIAYVVEGALRFELGEGDAMEEKIVRGGEVLVIPGDLPHAAEALEDTIHLDIFAPPRQDWISGDDSYLR